MVGQAKPLPLLFTYRNNPGRVGRLVLKLINWEFSSNVETVVCKELDHPLIGAVIMINPAWFAVLSDHQKAETLMRTVNDAIHPEKS